MAREYDFELQYLKNQLAHEGQWWLVLLDFSCSFIWAQLVLSPEFPFKTLNCRTHCVTLTLRKKWCQIEVLEMALEKKSRLTRSIVIKLPVIGLKIDHMRSFLIIFCKYFFLVVYYSVYMDSENQDPENRQNSESWNKFVIFEIDVSR